MSKSTLYQQRLMISILGINNYLTTSYGFLCGKLSILDPGYLRWEREVGIVPFNPMVQLPRPIMDVVWCVTRCKKKERNPGKKRCKKEKDYLKFIYYRAYIYFIGFVNTTIVGPELLQCRFIWATSTFYW